MNPNSDSVSGNGHKSKALIFERPPQRVISLVPSITESLFDLGFGTSVVGVTDYCVHPAKDLTNIARIGGPKTPDINAILSLKPDLVAANMEENPIEAVEELEDAGVKVWVTFPQTIRQALDVLWLLVGLFKSRPAAIRLETLELTVEWAEAALENRKTRSYFYPIWRDESGWMTFNSQTYVNDVMRILGGQNVFADRDYDNPTRHKPLPSQPIRYPYVTKTDILETSPDVVVLPSEPYSFGETDCNHFYEQFPSLPAVINKNIYCIDGSLITWHGTRLARALRDLPHLLGDANQVP